MIEDKYESVINKLVFIIKKGEIEIITDKNYGNSESYIIRVIKNGKEINKEKSIGIQKTNKKIFNLKKYYKKLYS